MTAKTDSNFIQYFLLVFLIGTTGIPFFMYSIEYIIVGLLLAFIVFIHKGLKFNLTFFIIFCSFIIVEVLQSLIFNFWSFETFFGTYMRLLFAFLVIKIIGYSFTVKYINVLKVICYISIVFYVLHLISSTFTFFFIDNIGNFISDPFLEAKKYETNLDIIIFNFHGLTETYWVNPRNSGPFWEPGAFGGFIIIGLFLKLIYDQKLFDRSGLISLVVLITTFSTTAYIAYFFLFIFYLYQAKQKLKIYLFLKVISIPIFILIFINLYNSLYFLKEKINSQLVTVNFHDLSSYDAWEETNRFASAYKDIYDFAHYPLTGLGRNETVRFKGADMDNRKLTHRNNGVTYLLATYGILIFVLYFYLIFKGYKNLSNNSRLSYLGVVLLFIIGFSEMYFTRVFFYGLMMLSTLTPKQINEGRSLQ